MTTGTAAPERETDRSAAAPDGGDATARPDRRPVAVVWADSFTDHFSPEVGVAAVEVLERAGFTVRIVGQRACCSLTWITTGQLDAARRVLRRTVDVLDAELADADVVVGLEPSCTAVLRSDAAELLPGDPAVERVAAGVLTLAETLTRHAPDWRPPDLSGRQVLAQPHCHHHAVLGWDTDAALLRRTGAAVEAVGGCCGLAGNFGAERGHFDVSVAVAETALLPAVRRAGADDVVLADGFSCRTQLDHLSDRRGRHLAELLAEHLGES